MVGVSKIARLRCQSLYFWDFPRESLSGDETGTPGSNQTGQVKF